MPVGEWVPDTVPESVPGSVPGSVPDMDDHTHVLIFNCTRSPDGRILGGLKRDGEYYSALYDSRYVANLEKLD